MSKRNGKKRKRIHGEQLVQSTEDMVQLGAALAPRFSLTVSMYRDRWGTPPRIDADRKASIVLWRTMAVRHSTGDWRNTESEEKATKEVAQWCLDLYRMLRGQLTETIKWRE